MLTKLLLAILVINTSYQKCLNKKVLKELGFKPLDAPELIEDPGVCKGVLKDAKSCVDLDQFEKYVNGFRNSKNKKRKEKYKKFKDHKNKMKAKFAELKDSDKAKDWSDRLKKQMSEVMLETNSFEIYLIFESWTLEKLNDDNSLISQVMIPLNE